MPKVLLVLFLAGWFLVTGCAMQKVTALRYNNREGIVGFHAELVVGHKFGCVLQRVEVSKRNAEGARLLDSSWDTQVWASYQLPDGSVDERGFQQLWATQQGSEDAANKSCKRF